MTEYAKYRNIVISLSNYEKLREIGPDDSFNKVISRLIETAEQQEPSENNR
jgi:predicted CopG family antitoxin